MSRRLWWRAARFTMMLSGAGILNATQVLARIDGVTTIHQLDDDTE